MGSTHNTGHKILIETLQLGINGELNSLYMVLVPSFEDQAKHNKKDHTWIKYVQLFWLAINQDVNFKKGTKGYPNILLNIAICVKVCRSG